MMKQAVLKLNKGFFPIDTTTWESAMTQIFSGAVHPLDVSYEVESDGTVNKNVISYMEVVRDFASWQTLPIRKYDETVKTSKGLIRVPTIVICSKFNKVPLKKAVFPTNSNIRERDEWTCQYTGQKLTRDNVSIDHIIPRSRGGENTWENLVVCELDLNIWKGDRTPKECGLRLIRKPFKPKNIKTAKFMRDEWKNFVDGGSFETT
jgi:5-methylcytosine-specific restriction endonuclease McrA